MESTENNLIKASTLVVIVETVVSKKITVFNTLECQTANILML